MNGRIVPMFLIDELPGADLGDLFAGVRILEPAAAEPGTITITNDKGEVLGRIVNIGQLKEGPPRDLDAETLEAFTTYGSWGSIAAHQAKLALHRILDRLKKAEAPCPDDMAMDLLEARQEVERLRELLDGARNWVQDPDLRRRIHAVAPPKARTE